MKLGLHHFPLVVIRFCFVCVPFQWYLRIIKCEKKYPDRYLFMLSGTSDVSASSLWLSLNVYRVCISASISESSEYSCDHSCSMLHSGCSKHNVIASKILFLFRSTEITKSFALSVSSRTVLIKINWHVPSPWQACNHKTAWLYNNQRKLIKLLIKKTYSCPKPLFKKAV